MNQKSVLIMMATYNGADYISAQIKSIINQTYSNWKLIIQDDGSTDETLKVACEFQKHEPRIIEIRKSDCKFHGPFCNFHSLANYCKANYLFDYYMFCDQDDIWNNNKIEIFINYMNKRNNSIPQLCYADMDIMNDNEKLISESTDKILGINYKNKYSVFFSYNVYGCNLIMNRKAFFSVPMLNTNAEYIKILSHDNLYTEFSATLGNVSFYPQVLMHYRRHSNNVTGKREYSFTIKRIINRILNINSLAKDHALTYNQTLIALKLIYKEYQLPVCKEIEDIIKNGGFQSLIYILKHHISWGKPVKTISRSFILLSGLYKKYLIEYAI